VTQFNKADVHKKIRRKQYDYIMSLPEIIELEPMQLF
jgi:hypothetical protein